MKKITTLRLFLLLVVLLIIYAGAEFFSSTGRSKSLRKELVSIDTASVTRLNITKENFTTYLSKTDDLWKVSDGEKSFRAELSKVIGTLMSLQTIQPSRIATRNPEKWKEFQVDSTGTRIEIFDGDKKSLDIVLGRFGMQGQQQFFTYVRLFDDKDVYVANNFMTFSIPTDVAGFRNQELTSISKDSITAFRFHYPSDSSFLIEKNPEDKWVIGNNAADSAVIHSYLQMISRLNSSRFDNNHSASIFDNPEYEVSILIKSGNPVNIKSIRINNQFLLQSDVNPEAIISDSELFSKIFINRDNFIEGNK